MSRLPSIRPEQMNDSQRRLFEHITGGKRSEGRARKTFFTPAGGLIGPFNAWMYSPEIGDLAQRLGGALRFETSLSPLLKELAILTVAARWKSQYEWWAHAQISKKLGMNERVIAQLQAGENPSLDDPNQRAVYAFVRELLDRRRVSDRCYGEAIGLLGDAGVVELVMLVGYYTMVSMTLNVFQVAVPPGEPAPFADEDVD